MDERTRSPDQADPESLLAMLPDPEPVSGQRPRRRASEDRLGGIEATLELMSQTVSQLAATVRRIVDNQSDRTATDLPAAGGPATVDDELVEWVCWLIDRYDIGLYIPPCWAEHPDLIDELEALRRGWLATVAPGRVGLDALVWHDHRRRWIASLEHRGRSCDTEHREPYGPPASQTHRSHAPRLEPHTDYEPPDPTR